MIRYVGRVLIPAAVAVTGALALSAAVDVDAVARAGQTSGGALSVRPAGTGAPGSQLWVRRYAGPGGEHRSTAYAVAVSPTGRAVFVTGYSARGVATIAYNTTTGARLWLSRYSGPPGTGSQAGATVRAMAISPDGRTVSVAASTGRGGGDYATLAYNAATGAQMWLTRYHGTGGINHSNAIAVSRDGKAVFVTGSSEGVASRSDYATVAYSSSTGRQLWVARYNGPANGSDGASAIAVSPSGGRVFVTGVSEGPAGVREPGVDYATVAYSAATGRQLWVRRYTSGGAHSDDYAAAVAVGPHGHRVFVTGTSVKDAVTIAYTAAGRRLWLARYRGAGGAVAPSMVLSPTGRTVFVAGGREHGYIAIAYGTGVGRRLWVRVYKGPNGGGEPFDVAIGPGGRRLYVTGYTVGTADYDYATVAYRSATGARLWSTRYNGTANAGDYATAIAVSPGGGRVFVTGKSAGLSPPGERTGLDFATVAYRG